MYRQDTQYWKYIHYYVARQKKANSATVWLFKNEQPFYKKGDLY